MDLPGIAVDSIDEWQRASPTGGFVTTVDLRATELTPGMVVRVSGGGWQVVAARASRLQTVTGLFPTANPVFGWHAVLLNGRWLNLWPHSYAQIRTDLHVQEDAL